MGQRLRSGSGGCPSGLNPRNRHRSENLPGFKGHLGDSDAIVHDARDRAGRPVSALIRTYGGQSHALISYLEACMASLREEQVRVLFFNDSCDAIADERVWLGTATEVEMPIGELVRHAFACGSPMLLIAHNHPSGIAQPSRMDVDFTRRLVKICKELQIRVHDHIIVTHKGSFSFRELGYM
ncbi:hypothetical protein AI27_14510 [Sphingomonas sp. BHC-A]|nr:hypothetical protein AI27_14510 [Sphingomonas sp. BHC-A]